MSSEKQQRSYLNKSESGLVEAKMLINLQPNTESVLLKKATLTQPGFLVLREVVDGKAAQIVEISSYLEIGTYTDIIIPVGEFYTGDTELMAVIYTDEGNDRILNDLDQPFVDTDGNIVATYTATGFSVEGEVFKGVQDIQSMNMGDMNMQTVRYTNEGFEPSVLEVKKGSVVHFVNESNMQMWVATDNHPAHDILPTFDQFKPGDMYMYIFEELGEWVYHDHLNAALTGSIIVTN
jgi:plastocyanin